MKPDFTNFHYNQRINALKNGDIFYLGFVKYILVGKNPVRNNEYIAVNEYGSVTTFNQNQRVEKIG